MTSAILDQKRKPNSRIKRATTAVDQTITMACLATLGNEVKIWEVPSFQLQEHFNPFDDSVADFTWSHDGLMMACCSSTNKSVCLRNTASLSIPSESLDIPAYCQTFDFNSDSRFLLCGCTNGSVHIVDWKTKSLSKSFTNLKAAVTAVRWNWNDKCIAAGTEKGEIVLYNIVTGQASSPLVTPATQAITQLKYNPYRKAVLASASEDGVINFWDTNTRRLYHSFCDTHHAPAKDLAFSPINDILLASVGLDKRFVLYDIQSKTPVNSILADHPLTCVDFLHDGATLAMGTMRGDVLLYDMRHSSRPMFTLPAHRTLVKRVAFTKKGIGNETALNDISSSVQNLRRQLPDSSLRRQLPDSSPHRDHQLHNVSAYQSPPSEKYDKYEADIFSLLSAENQSNNNSASIASDSSWNLVGAENINASNNSMDIFSPLGKSCASSHHSSIGGTSFIDKIFGPSENSHNITRSRNSLAAGGSHLNSISEVVESDQMNTPNSHTPPQQTHNANVHKLPGVREERDANVHKLPGVREERGANVHKLPGVKEERVVSASSDTSTVVNDSKLSKISNLGGSSSSPAKGDNSSSPAKGDNLSSPAKGDNSSSPTKGGNPSSPTKGGNSSSPTKGGSHIEKNEESNCQPNDQSADLPRSNNLLTREEFGWEMYHLRGDMSDFMMAIYREIVDIQMTLERVEPQLEGAAVNTRLLMEIERLRAENEMLKQSQTF